MRRMPRRPGLAAASLMAAALTWPAPAGGQAVARPLPARASAASGWIGINLDANEVHHADGRVESRLVIRGVVDGSPADGAGIRPGDQIVGLNGRTATFRDFSRLAARLRPGDRFRLTLLSREGWSREVDLEAVARPAAELVTLPRELVVRLDSAMQRLDSLRIRITRADGGDADVILTGGRGTSASASSGLSRILAVSGDSTLTVVSAEGFGGTLWSTLASWAPDPAADALPDPGVGVPFSRFLVLDRDSTAERALLRAGGQTGELQVVEAMGDMEGFRPLSPYIWGQNRVAGAEVTSLNPELAGYFHVSRGLLVTDVTEGTPAGEAGIQPGDVVVQVGGTSVASPAELRRALSRPGGAPLVLRIVRRGATLDVTLPR